MADDPASEGRAVMMRKDDGAMTESLVDRDRDAAKQFGDRATGAAGVASAVGP